MLAAIVAELAQDANHKGAFVLTARLVRWIFASLTLEYTDNLSVDIKKMREGLALTYHNIPQILNR
jgi:hypothetical protein